MTPADRADDRRPRRLGDFEILEPLHGTGPRFRAVQHLGHGVTRDATVRLVGHHGSSGRREIELLGELGACPNVVTVYGCGVDERFGSWIAMEPARRSLADALTDAPAAPALVRAVLRDMLRALAVLHGAEPAIMHRNLGPASIVRSSFGAWQISDFGVAARGDAGGPLDPASVQYAAPEMLDPARGPESPRADLYSLGMIAYELALGRRLFRRQFPSVHDPDGGRADRAAIGQRWMYWHASESMTAPRLADLLDGFPEDLSNLVASMMAKPIGERLASAGLGLRVLAEELPGGEPAPAAVDRRRRRLTRAAGAGLGLIAVAAVIAIARAAATPRIVLRGDGAFAGTDPIVVSGLIERFPDGGSAELIVEGGAAFPARIAGGEFVCEATVPRLGPVAGTLVVADRRGRRVAERLVRLDRRPPAAVQISLRTDPPAAGARVRITRPGAAAPMELTTDARGSIRADLAYGPFTLEIRHPRFEAFRAATDTGIEPVARRRARLEPLDPDAMRRMSLDELEQAVRRQVPAGALAVERGIDRIRVRGPVLTAAEKRHLAARLVEAQPRVDLSEVLVDPWALAARLAARLADAGAEHVDVVPYLTPREQILYVLFNPAGRVDAERVRALAGEFVFDRDLVHPHAVAAALWPAQTFQGVPKISPAAGLRRHGHGPLLASSSSRSDVP